MKLAKYQIFGERNSGTNYLDYILQFNLFLKPTSEFGYKHWYIKNHYPRGKSNTTTDNECITSLKHSNDTLFIFIVREPISWLQSMHRTPWHAHDHKGLSFQEFIRKPWNSYELELPAGHDINSTTPWFKSKNGKYFIEDAKNICQLRNNKNEHFLALENDVNNFFIIRQENLLDDLKLMFEIFKIQTKFQNLILPNYRSPIGPQEIELADFEFIYKQLDLRIEHLLGYELKRQKIANF